MPRALVVDDSREFRALLSRALQKENINCDVAEDGVLAEYMLENNRYDLLLTDLRMPRKHGHQLITDVLSRPDPPLIVAMTGVIEPRLVADLIGRGVVDVIQKPLAFDVIAAKAKALLARHSARKSPTASVNGASMVAEEIGRATEAMRLQLAQVTASFESAIKDLERQKEDLEEGFHGSLRVLTNLFDQMETAYGSHAGRVEKLASRMAEKLGLKAGERRDLVYASLLHDVGQFGMPDAIRTKAPWALSEREQKVFRSYPLIGAMLLSEVRGAERVAELVEAHAENYDGSGFPKKLKDIGIPLESRIIRIADGCDTHLMFGKYEHALEELHKHLFAGAKRAYDPELIDVAMSCARETLVAPAEEDVVELQVRDAHPGMILAGNVYDEDGRFLAREGAELSAKMIARMRWLVGDQTIKVHKSKPAPSE
ncbi:MAG: response regulator [Candidatus Hydrogenedentes bacterium]|nr:response regulator [Candidatus Hydrogenedentota bacterium]